MIDKEMKKLSLTLALSCAIVFAVGAQPRALGFRYNGYSDAPFELSYQHWLFSNNVLEISVGDNYMDGGYVYNDGYEDNSPVYELGQGWLNSTFMRLMKGQLRFTSWTALFQCCPKCFQTTSAPSVRTKKS